MIPWPVSQHALHDCRLTLSDGQVDHASLFPFFDRQGVVRSLMLTTRDASTISFVDWKPGMARKWPFLARQIDLRLSDCVDVDPDAASNLAELWHFDPWWELRSLRYSGHRAVPHLKATNLPGFDKSLKRVWFDPDLKRVKLVALREEGDGATLEDGLSSYSVKPFAPSLLRAAEAARETTRPESSWQKPANRQWRLRPFWN